MIDHHGVLIHLDAKGDRFDNADFEFQGWVAAHEPIRAVWLPAEENRPFALCERPDVIRVFPGRTACGFLGATREKGSALRLAVQVGQDTFEVEHPLPPLLRSEEHTSELQSRRDLVCRLLLEKKKIEKREPTSD